MGGRVYGIYIDKSTALFEAVSHIRCVISPVAEHEEEYMRSASFHHGCQTPDLVPRNLVHCAHDADGRNHSASVVEYRRANAASTELILLVIHGVTQLPHPCQMLFQFSQRGNCLLVVFSRKILARTCLSNSSGDRKATNAFPAAVEFTSIARPGHVPILPPPVLQFFPMTIACPDSSTARCTAAPVLSMSDTSKGRATSLICKFSQRSAAQADQPESKARISARCGRPFARSVRFPEPSTSET